MASGACITAVAAVFIAAGISCVRQSLTAPIDAWDVPDLKGKVFVITGTTSGIGLETARALGGWHADVVCANRNLSKSRSTAPPGNMEHRELDLASFASVRAFAKGFLDQGRKIDVLILNAATDTPRSLVHYQVEHATDAKDVSQDGVDMQYQVNHLSHFLLVNLLLPVLADDARVVFVSSTLHGNGVIDKMVYGPQAKGVDPDTVTAGFQLYSDTKLMNVMTAIELDQRLKQAGRSNIAVTSVNPGVVNSNLGQFLVMPLIRPLIARDPASGSLTQLRVATDKSLANAGGRYFSDDCINTLCAGVEADTVTQDASLRGWVWDTSEEIVGGF